MEQRTLELNVISAKHLQNVNYISRMDVYVVVSVTGEPHLKQRVKTNVDRQGGTHPTWNFPIKFSIDGALLHQDRLNLVLRLRCDRLLGDRDIGEVNVPVRELLESAGGETAAMKFVSYQVRKPSGRGKGEISFSYRFGDEKQIVTAYPVVGSSSGPYYGGGGPEPGPYQGYGYPPPPPPAEAPYPVYHQQPGGYGYPPQPPPGEYYGYPPPQAGGYGYPPPAEAPYPVYHQQPGGYGYPPQPPPGGYYGYPPPQAGGYGYPPPPVQQQAKKNKFGMGLGAGLLGGALGGLLIGDMISDGGGF